MIATFFVWLGLGYLTLGWPIFMLALPHMEKATPIGALIFSADYILIAYCILSIVVFSIYISREFKVKYYKGLIYSILLCIGLPMSIRVFSTMISYLSELKTNIGEIGNYVDVIVIFLIICVGLTCALLEKNKTENKNDDK